MMWAARSALAAAGLLAMAGCATVPPATGGSPVAVPGTGSANAIGDRRGLEAVLGKDEARLRQMFGEPRLNVIEPVGRKLQFTGAPCILDAYLYPDRSGRELVAHVDARRRDGAAVDRAACVSALQKK